MADEFVIDKDTFWDRVKRLYQNWTKSQDDPKSWNGADSVMINFGAPNEDVSYSKTSSLHFWFFGYEFTQMVLVLTQTKVYILTSPKKIKILQTLQEYTGEKVVELEFLTLTPEDQTAPEKSENVKTIISAMKKSHKGKSVGYLAKEKQVGNFIEAFNKEVFDKTEGKDITLAISSLLSVKDDKELKNCKAAAIISTHILKKILKSQIESIIDVGKKVTHNELAGEAEKLFEDPRSISQQLDPKHIDSCYTPMIQSGGKYDTKPGSPNNDDNLDSGTIILSLGARYRYYCSNLARTFFVNPTEEHQNCYNFIVELQQHLLTLLKPGVVFNTIYNEGVKFIEQKRPDLLPKFGKSFGFGIGLEFQDANLIINQKNENVVKENMIINLSLNLNKVDAPSETNPKRKVFSVLISDTIQVKNEENLVLTDKSSKKWNEVSYALADEDEKKEGDDDVMEVDSKVVPKKEKESSSKSDSKRSAAAELKSKSISKLTKEDLLNMPKSKRGQDKIEEKGKSLEAEAKRKKHQQMLEEKQREEVELRFANAGPKKADVKTTGPVAVSYKSASEFPRDIIARNKVYVDEQRESILVPIYGLLVPFHVSNIKNASKTDEHYLRINFTIPEKIAKLDKDTKEKEKEKSEDKDKDNNNENSDSEKEEQNICIKELTYKIPNDKNLNNCLRMIKELRKRITQRQNVQSQTVGLVAQEKLILSKGRNPRLQDVFVRPSSTGRKTNGVLESHLNGFRFVPQKGENIDIMYKNIKHAFFQPADKELLVLIHFHLHNPIMIGKKKTGDVQFCTEVMEVSQSLDGRGKYDPDELEDEQRERAHRAKINNEYQTFVRKVEEFISSNTNSNSNNVTTLEFDMPYRDLGFYGVPNRANVFLQPSVNCLVSLAEQPFFVVTLIDIEIAYFERVQFSLKNFDLVFVPKDYSKPVTHVNSIPIDYLETIKEWLDSCNIIYYQGMQSLNWNNIMKTIQADPKKFHTVDGGWKVLSPDSDDEESDSEPESDFDPASSDDDAGASESEEDEYGSGSDDDDDDEDGYSDEEGSEESDNDWDSLEKKARQEDEDRAKDRSKRGRDFDSDDGSEDEKPKKKSKPSSSSSSSSKPSSSSSSKPSSSSSKPSSSSSSKSSSSSSSKPVHPLFKKK